MEKEQFDELLTAVGQAREILDEQTWKQYKRKGVSEMRPYVEGEELSRVSISQADLENGSPKIGDMIARNPKDHSDQWLVAAKYFQENLEPV